MGPKHSDLFCLILVFYYSDEYTHCHFVFLGLCDSIDEKTKQVKKIKDEKAKLKVV